MGAAIGMHSVTLVGVPFSRLGHMAISGGIEQPVPHQARCLRRMMPGQMRVQVP